MSCCLYSRDSSVHSGLLTVCLPLVVLLLADCCVRTCGGSIEDCCCDTETIDRNNEHVHSILNELKNTTYFRVFQVDLYKACSLWADTGVCLESRCSIEECCEVPLSWRKADALSAMLNTDVSEQHFSEWRDDDSRQWVEATKGKSIYVDLAKNKDGYTGYKGAEASRVWRAIYQTKANASFNGTDSMEERVLFKLISGFHTLTSAMVFANYPLQDSATNGFFAQEQSSSGPPQFGPSLELYRRFMYPFPQFIHNLYFDTVFLLRALNKARAVVSNWDYSTESTVEGASEAQRTAALMRRLVDCEFIAERCSANASFDESQMFNGNPQLKDDFRRVFRNISAVLDCVGCEKCRLHAKLEFLGLGTALKILFADELRAECLERNELIALIATLAKFSDAIQFVNQMEAVIAAEKAEL